VFHASYWFLVDNFFLFTILSFVDTGFDYSIFFNRSCEERNSLYYLAGVIEHVGSTPTSGHYIAYVKAKSGDWFRASDHVTRKVSLQEVLQCEAYMLFYEKGSD
jgi:ubiquitin carboxyl-terminal hydrolase 16/45